MKQLNIPRKVKIDSRWYSVEILEAMQNKSLMGEVDHIKRKIQIGRKTHHGVPFKLSAVHETYWHEVVHCILDSMGEHALNANETFVEEFSRRLAQSIETARF